MRIWYCGICKRHYDADDKGCGCREGISRRCGDCEWWDDEGAYIGGVRVGKCRIRSSPQPVMYITWWCGEFRAKASKLVK